MNGQNKPVFKVRCSAISAIMSNPVGGSPKEKYEKKLFELREEEAKYDAMANKETKTAYNKLEKIQKIQADLEVLEKDKDKVILSKTCTAHLEEWIKANYYGRKKQLDTKQLSKGIECENEAVFVLNQALGTNYKKAVYNDGERMENERCTGHEDIDDKENKKIIDTKVSYSFDSFPIIKDDLEDAYYWQGQGYMFLKGEEYKKHQVAKVLVNTPAWQVKQLLYNLYMTLCKKYDDNMEYVEPEYEKKSKEIFLGHVFDKQLVVESNGDTLQLNDNEVIPWDQRVKIFDVERNDEDIERIKARVEECRLWLSQNGF